MEATIPTNELQKYLGILKKEALLKTIKEREKGWRRHLVTAVNKQQRAKVEKEVTELCKKGAADLNHLENERRFAIMPNVFWSKKLMQFFVRNKRMNVNSQDENGDTALHLAIRHTNFDDGRVVETIIKFLLEDLNADPKVTNLRGETPFFTLFKWIAGRETPFSPYWGLAAKFNTSKMDRITKVAKMLMDRGGPEVATIRNCDGENVLHIVDNYSMKKKLIRVFEDEIDVRTSAWLYSKTPLMMAASRGVNSWGEKDRPRPKTCDFLLEMGAFVNATDLQGYTALHHAVLNGAKKCAEFLIRKGADLNVKSSSGRDPYDLHIRRPRIDHERYLKKLKKFIFENGIFTQGATPRRQVEILEMEGARIISKDLETYGAILIWGLAKDICLKENLEESNEFLTNYRFLEENLENPHRLEEMRCSAIKTVARLSAESEMSKFWNLLSLTQHEHSDDYPCNVFNILNFLSSEDLLKRVEDFASLEEIDFYSLWEVAECFANWTDDLNVVDESRSSRLKRISHVHSIARLAIACFNKLMHVTKSKTVPKMCIKLYVTLCYALNSLHSLFADDVISVELLKKLIELDLRDRDSNSLMHLVIKTYDFHNYDLLISLLDVKSKNRAGFEPAQFLSLDHAFDVLVKMADRGAHVDAKNATLGKPTMREQFEMEDRQDLAFRYDNLQCACARVLVRNLVPYRNYLGAKHLIDFIQEH